MKGEISRARAHEERKGGLFSIGAMSVLGGTWNKSDVLVIRLCSGSHACPDLFSFIF